MSSMIRATLGLIKAGVDKVEKIQSKSVKDVQARLAPTINHREGFYNHVVLAGTSGPVPIGEEQPYIATAPERLASINAHPTKYGHRVAMSFETDHFDHYNEAAKATKEFTNHFRRLRNRIGAFPFNNAFAAGVLIYDGQPLCSTAHTSASGVAARANRPTVASALGVLTLELETQELMKTLDARGEYMEFEDEPIELITGPDLRMLAYRLCNATGMPQSANNDPNAVMHQQFSTNYITLATAWFLRVRGEDNHGLRTILFSPVMVKAGENDDIDQKYVQAKQLIGSIVTRWEGLRGNPGA